MYKAYFSVLGEQQIPATSDILGVWDEIQFILSLGFCLDLSGFLLGVVLHVTCSPENYQLLHLKITQLKSRTSSEPSTYHGFRFQPLIWVYLSKSPHIQLEDSHSFSFEFSVPEIPWENIGGTEKNGGILTFLKAVLVRLHFREISTKPHPQNNRT